MSTSPGSAHCDLHDDSFLTVRDDASPAGYVRDDDGEFADLTRTSWSDTATLPPDAEDTGYRREGRELWLVPDGEAAYLVDADDPSDVERWPAFEEPIGCA